MATVLNVAKKTRLIQKAAEKLKKSAVILRRVDENDPWKYTVFIKDNIPEALKKLPRLLV